MTDVDEDGTELYVIVARSHDIVNTVIVRWRWIEYEANNLSTSVMTALLPAMGTVAAGLNIEAIVLCQRMQLQASPGQQCEWVSECV